MNMNWMNMFMNYELAPDHIPFQLKLWMECARSESFVNMNWMNMFMNYHLIIYDRTDSFANINWMNKLMNHHPIIFLSIWKECNHKDSYMNMNWINMFINCRPIILSNYYQSYEIINKCIILEYYFPIENLIGIRW